MTTKRKESKGPMFVVLIILLIVGWFVAPLFFPVYLWLHVDLEEEARRAGVPLETLKIEHDIILRYNPRGNDKRDPAPWEILEMSPEWFEQNSKEWPREDEFEISVRCVILSDQTGEPPNKLFIGGLEKDRYFRCKGIRLKPGSLGSTSTRPVVLYRGSTWEKLDPSMSFEYNTGREFYPYDEYIGDKYNDYWFPEDQPPLEEENSEGTDAEAAE